ncbi:hypothetical protein K438DRAFT_1788759 [Mycena galopus ATCC 62051]|nr:hypothetical protein K438DRAFT_1788759 [Mycena galopus ATCC 62051]
MGFARIEGSLSAQDPAYWYLSALFLAYDFALLRTRAHSGHPQLRVSLGRLHNFGPLRSMSLGVGLQGGLALGLLEISPLGTTIPNLYPIFRELLEKSPHLAAHIRTLHIGLPPLQTEIPPYVTALSAGDCAIIQESLLSVLRLLQGKGLMSVGLFPCGPERHTFHLQPCIADLLQTLSLESLSFCDWVFPDHSALVSLGNSSHKYLNFVDCLGVFAKYWIPALWFTERLTVNIELGAEAATILSMIAPFVHQQLTINIDKVFADDLTTFRGQIQMNWLETAFEDIVLRDNLTLSLTIATTFACHVDWEAGLGR